MRRGKGWRTTERLVYFVFGVAAALLITFTTTAALSLLRTLSTDAIIFKLREDLAEIERLRHDTEREARLAQTWLLTRDEAVRRDLEEATGVIDLRVQQLDARISLPETELLLERVARLERQQRRALDALLTGPDVRESEETIAHFEERLHRFLPVRTELNAAIEELAVHQEQMVAAALRASEKRARQSLAFLLGAAALCAAAALALGARLARAVRAQAIQQQELERNVERVALANRDLEAFAGRISHDLRNMLSPAVLAVSRLKRAKLEPGSPDALTVARLQSSLARTLRTMEGLLAFSRAGQPADPLATSDARTVLDEVVEEVQGLASDLEAQLEVSSHGPTAVRIGEGLLHVVLANLVGNALKYLQGRPIRRVVVQIDGGPEWTTLTVEDTGPGIQPSQLTRIFEAFYRVPGQTVAGTGIGLATVKRIVEAHEGRVEAKSEPGTGARFVVMLPSASLPVARTQDEPAPRPH